MIHQQVSGGSGALANPGLVMHFSIGQTTNATRRAIANLYYRSVRILRPVHIGETLTTTTTVLGLRESAPKGDQHRGKVWLGITTSSEHGPVVEYERCALIPARAVEQVMPMTFRARLTPLLSANSSERFLTGTCRPCLPRIGRSMKSVDRSITSISQHHSREAPSIRQRCTETTPLVLAADDLSTAGMCKLCASVSHPHSSGPRPRRVMGWVRSCRPCV